MNFLMPGYVPPVNKDVKAPESITDHNQIKSTEGVYQLTAEDVKKNLKSLDKKVGDKLDGPDQTEISGQNQLEVTEAKDYSVANPGDFIKATNNNVYLSNALTLEDTAGTWVPGLNGVPANANAIVWVKGVSIGSTTLQNLVDSSDPDKNIEVIAEGTPITLQKFDIEVVDDKYPYLTWTTASETNNDYFAIERSFDGVSFEQIDTVDSKAKNGTSRGPLDYEYTDKTEGLHGDVFYRFIQNDKDGTKKTYEIKSVHIENKDLAPVLSPNPARSGGSVNLEIFDKNNSAYSIVNIHGQTMQEGKLRVGDNALSLAGFPAGIYSIQIKGGETVRLEVVH